MREVFATARRWYDERVPFALATLVAVHDASPAPVGATMAVAADGRIAGDIGAGCYDAEIVDAATATARDGRARPLAIDLGGDDPLGGGSSCGGRLDIVTWKPRAGFGTLAGDVVAGRDAVALRVTYEAADGPRTFAWTVPARRRAIVVGATTLAQAVATLAANLDYRTIVVDPRPAFATVARLPAVDEIVLAWPDDVLGALLDATTPLVVLSHDPKIDVPALIAGLASPAPYVGLLGSRRSQAVRRASLREAGVADQALARIHGPVGLDLGAVSPAEIALAILADIVATERGRAGGRLAEPTGLGSDDQAMRSSMRTGSSRTRTPVA